MSTVPVRLLSFIEFQEVTGDSQFTGKRQVLEIF